MAFAGIFQPFARLRWIRFGLLMRDRKSSRRFSVPQTTALAPLPFANRHDYFGRTVARASVEEHMANYQAARALMGKGNSERVRERGSSAKKGAKKSAVKKANQ